MRVRDAEDAIYDGLRALLWRRYLCHVDPRRRAHVLYGDWLDETERSMMTADQRYLSEGSMALLATTSTAEPKVVATPALLTA